MCQKRESRKRTFTIMVRWKLSTLFRFVYSGNDSMERVGMFQAIQNAANIEHPISVISYDMAGIYSGLPYILVL